MTPDDARYTLAAIFAGERTVDLLRVATVFLDDLEPGAALGLPATPARREAELTIDAAWDVLERRAADAVARARGRHGAAAVTAALTRSIP